jgi:hypothetical protein
MVLSRGALIFSHSFCVLFSFWGFVGVFRSWCGCSLRGVGVPFVVWVWVYAHICRGDRSAGPHAPYFQVYFFNSFFLTVLMLVLLRNFSQLLIFRFACSEFSGIFFFVLCA